MLTNITIENFKKLERISFPLSQSVVIIGPNNSGKSTIFQALCLWEIGVKNYIAAYQKNDLNRQGTITINRRDLLNSPIADARFLWKSKKVTQRNISGAGQKHVPLSIELEGDNNGVQWSCQAEFTFSNSESFSCKICTGLQQMVELYENEHGLHFGFLQPMSGISTTEDKLTKGSIDRKLGEGKTAEVLRNICFEILNPETASKNRNNAENNWLQLCNVIKVMFGVILQKPEFIKATGLISLEYIENNIKYDISSGGRGFQQTLLLFSYMFANPNTILLLDEPDAHLEVIRQREVFQKINDIATITNSQLLVASHSEVVLDEAAEASKVIALIENQTFEVNTSTNSKSIQYIKKALTEIGWEKYYLAKSKGHILYLEGSTDLQMLLAFATALNHNVAALLRFANVSYTSDNVPNTAVANFVALKEIFPELKGLAIFDKIEKNLNDIKPLTVVCWQKRELENYFARPYLLIKYAQSLHEKYEQFSLEQLEKAMKKAIEDFTLRAYLNDLNHNWWNSAKLSSEWLDNIFPEFYKQLNVPLNFYKRDYYQLIALMERQDIADEIVDKLDLIYEILK
uniref:RecF/RecN/SMC N-terminal domain-containing protein n=1 Tax=Chlorobium chlorochromatii (strain CaD3) TaxID=340177 RepID=Q3APQ2_CHLCH